VNAIQFALQNNFALSLEIGNAAATQITLIQMPVLVVIGAIISDGHQNPGFTLIFPLLDLVAVFLAMIIVNYISIEGKSNYFTGSALILVYVLLVSAFYFVPSTDGGSGSSDSSMNMSSVGSDSAGVGQFSMTKHLFDVATHLMNPSS
jgi:Ca2+:H+ antiporter